MTTTITRRQLITGGLKAGAALVVLHQFPQLATAAFIEDRYKAAFQLLDEFVVRHMTELGVPGMTVALADRNGLLRSSQYGFADMKAGIRVGEQTLFEIGSISKSFVAIAVLQLAEEGKLDLHKPVTDYLPWLKIDSKYKPFTTHHLLSHTAGLSGVPLLTRVAGTTLRVGYEPGTRWVYSNIGYVLLGFLIEALDKRSFAESMKQRVLVPLGMTSSAPVISNEIRRRLAVGYNPLQNDRPFALRGQLGEAAWLEVSEAAGSIASTSSDMGKYLKMLLTRGVGAKGRVLSEKSFEVFTKPVIKSPFRGEDASYAYGLWVSDTNGQVLLRHTGGMVAFSSAMFADTTNGFAAFASVNAARLLGAYRPIPVVRYALSLLNAASRKEELPAAPPPLPSLTIVKNAADYGGTFKLNSATGVEKLVLSNEGEQLILQHAGARIVLEQVGRDAFIVKHPHFELFTLNFGREKDQVVEAFYGGDWWINERYTGAQKFEYPKEWDAYAGHFHSDSPWYGSVRLIIRKGQLMVGGDQPLAPVEPGVFRPADDPSDADRITFDMFANGQAMRMNYSGIEFFRTFTP
jgi:D-alanyl-D-alanine carboxypeptidase